MKKFGEVFPDLKLNQDDAWLLDETVVEKVIATRDRKGIKVYLKSHYVIPYPVIQNIQNMITRQMFGGQVQALLYVSYDLSEQYTAEAIMQTYMDSIRMELESEDRVVAMVFEQAEKSFADHCHLIMRLPDNELIRIKAKILEERLEEIFRLRFERLLSIEYEWIEKARSKYAMIAEESMKEAVNQIVDTYEKAKSDQEAREKANSDDKQKKTEEFRKNYNRPPKLPEDPDIFYGRNFDGEETPIREITGELGEVVVRGMITEMETREIKNEKTIIIFAVTDFTDTIKGKVFVKNERLPQILDHLSSGSFIRMKAVAANDTFEHDISLGSVVGIKKIPDFRVKRMDGSPIKRVELHCHTTMSDSDGVSSVTDIIKTAMRWGHTSIAVTDHGVVQAFTDANHATEKTDFKVIYGTEGYLVDDLKDIVTHSQHQSLSHCSVVFDIETTGFSAEKDAIIEIGAVKVKDGEIIDRFSEFINPERPIPPEITKLTSITDAMVSDADTIDHVLPAFREFCRDAVLVAHNADFDTGFIHEKCRALGIDWDFTFMDTLPMARSFLPGLKNYKLDTMCEALDCVLDHHHRAVDDAEATAACFLKFLDMFREKEITELDQLNEYSKMDPDTIKKMRSFHVIILAKNEVGRINLYRLVSMAHLDYFGSGRSKRPLIPKSELQKYREGLIIGSACEAGELFRAIIDGRSQEEIAKIVRFYDYLEIQPTGNNEFMIRSEKREYSEIHSKADLEALNKRIVELGEMFDKPVCANCDVHFLNPEDEVYRRIIMHNKGFPDADLQAPLYLRTTEEMLQEFQYLGADKAMEVVVTNTNYIADMVDRIYPVRPDKCPPVIENSDVTLREICYAKAYEIYGENLPDIVTERLERELNSIIGNGFAVMYIIAQKLVWKSVADGYLVGSRGSVGSSFVAYMAGITEVNSLQAHYLCPECHYVDFDSEYVKSFSGLSGCDMEDKNCPVCGHPLIKDGHDIPFETFLGFKGNKEPDIDLNFSGEYQPKAHAYTEVIFGKGKTYRAGTVGTLADKTAYGYAMHYYEEHGVHKRPCEITRVSSGCVGVRRTTGQHPGGIIVVPHGEEIYSFTPVQHPANDQTTRIITTHFDYHSIDHNLLKLDILGHDDPTMIRMLEDLTQVDATTIRMDDQDVLSLFRGLDALGITKEDLGGTDLGSLGVPEFGTEFAMQMLRDIKPTQFSDLVRIAGLSHGTDVWLGNAQTLIKEGKAVISTAICTRDDIMTYLIHKGLESETSFKIMEAVRKGTVAKGKCGNWEEWKQDMLSHDVPDWYIWSCEKIKYMFPKAHAVAYVMMGMRIAWFKVHIPLAYYCSFFTIRATAFDYELMCQGKAAIDEHIKAYKSNPNLTAKDKDTLRDMKIVQEFYARGFEFIPIDIYRSKAAIFQIVDDKLLPPFTSIEGMGGIAAEALEIAAQGEKFLSKEDIRQRAKVSATTVETMSRLGILGDLPESNQLSFFDLGML